MNEMIFFLHILAVMAFVFAALKLGKTALISMVALQAVLANLFVVKQTVLFGFSVTCSDVFSVGSILALNLLQEYFGKDEAAKAVKISFLSLIFFALMSQIHLFYTPAPFDLSQEGFLSIFSSTPRIIIASIAVFYFVQRVDLVFFGWLLKRGVPLRLGISLIVSQFLDTFLFSFAGLYGLVASLFDIILISYLVKLLIIFCSAPIASFSKRFVQHENVSL